MLRPRGTPFLDGEAQEWLGFSLKTSPVSNLCLSLGAREVVQRPFPGTRGSRNLGLSARARPDPPPRGNSLRRALPGQGESWPKALEQKAADLGINVANLVPRGAVFEQFVHDPVVPRRSGIYEFCVVGIDLKAGNGVLRYHAWEPTGEHDQILPADEVERKLALKRYGGSLALSPRAALPHSDPTSLAGHFKEVVRWPCCSSKDGLIHGSRLPAVRDDGQPLVFSRQCGFQPRGHTDLVEHVILYWRQQWPKVAASASRILLFDATGKMAVRLQEMLPGVKIVAIDSPPVPSRQPLKSMRQKHVCEVDEGSYDAGQNRLLIPDGSFDIVLLPFLCARVCKGDVARFVILATECLRVASISVLICDDAYDPLSPDWWEASKAQLANKNATPILLDTPLPSCGASSTTAGSAPHHSSSSKNRLLILESSKTSSASDFAPLTIGEEVEMRVPRHNHWRRAVVTAVAEDGSSVRVRHLVSGAQEVREQDFSVTSGALRRPKVRVLPPPSPPCPASGEQVGDGRAAGVGSPRSAVAPSEFSGQRSVVDETEDVDEAPTGCDAAAVERSSLAQLAEDAISAAVERIIQQSSLAKAPPVPSVVGWQPPSEVPDSHGSSASSAETVLASEGTASIDEAACDALEEVFRRMQTSRSDDCHYPVSHSDADVVEKRSVTPSMFTHARTIDRESEATLSSEVVAAEALQDAMRAAVNTAPPA